MNIWINALKNNYRYVLNNYTLTTEDLFTLSLEELDEIYSNISKELDNLNVGKSLIESRNDIEIEELTNRKNIVSEVFDIKASEKAEIEKEVFRKSEKQKIMKLINEKKNEALKNASIEELEEMLNNL